MPASYWSGNYSAFVEARLNAFAAKSKLIGAMAKQRKHVEESIQEQNRKARQSGDDKQLKQAARCEGRAAGGAWVRGLQGMGCWNHHARARAHIGKPHITPPHALTSRRKKLEERWGSDKTENGRRYQVRCVPAGGMLPQAGRRVVLERSPWPLPTAAAPSRVPTRLRPPAAPFPVPSPSFAPTAEQARLLWHLQAAARGPGEAGPPRRLPPA